MEKDDKKLQSLMKMRNMKISMIIGYGIIVLVAIACVTLFALRENEKVLKNKVTSMTSTLGVQMGLNLDSYLSRMETLGTLAFSVENAYTYDPISKPLEEYDALNIEKSISSGLKELCLMENFVDYGIVYKNNKTVGKISNGTVQLLGDNLFSELEGMISRYRTQDGWKAGYKGDFERIYYVKRIHLNALLVISFYTTELESVFDNPDTMSEMAIRLTSPEYEILYSSTRDEKRNSLPDEILSRVKDRDYSAVMDDTYLTTVNTCNVGWYVICSIPSEIIMKERSEMQKYILLFAGIASLVAIVAGAVFSIRMADPVANVVSSINGEIREDGFPDVLGRKFFKDRVTSEISSSDPKYNRAIVIVSVDDFSDIVCNISRSYGDDLIAIAVNNIKNVFNDADSIGRLGESQFCIFMKPSIQSSSSYKTLISKKCKDLNDSFRNSVKGSDGYEYKISFSIGTATFPENGNNFSSIYDCAYKALYISQAKGQDTFTIYEEKK